MTKTMFRAKLGMACCLVSLLTLSLATPTRATDSAKLRGVQPEHVQQHVQRKLFNLDGEIDVNGNEAGPFTLAEYVSSDKSGTTQIYKTAQVIPGGTTLTCRMRLDASRSSGVPTLVIQAGSIFTSKFGDASKLCVSPSSYEDGCEVQYTSVPDEHFYAMVYDDWGNVFDAYISCTAPGVPNTAPISPAPTPVPTTLAPTPVPTTAFPTRAPSPTRVPTTRGPTTSVTIVCGPTPASPTPAPTPVPTTPPPTGGSCWDNMCLFFRGIRSQVAGYLLD